MIGVVLGAGAGRRLQPLTDGLPKTLLPVTADRTILDVVLGNLRHAGFDDVLIVTGFAADRVQARVAELQRRHGLTLHLLYNDKAEEWNNAYSLWLASEAFSEGVLLVNGDTVHPPCVEESVLAARGPDVLLAIDDQKPLAEEEMKVVLGDDDTMRRINKGLDPAAAAGEYIGVTLIEPPAAGPLGEALEATWRRDPQLYYEDGYQELVDRGGKVHVAPIGQVDWVEVDNHDDLARAREIACRY
ncbi:MAG: sugar phosphate nucleotidyltransferase [Carbonactinosporaceae bacterium]